MQGVSDGAIADVLNVLFENEHYKPLKTKRKISAGGAVYISKLLKTLYKRRAFT